MFKIGTYLSLWIMVGKSIECRVLTYKGHMVSICHVSNSNL